MENIRESHRQPARIPPALRPLLVSCVFDGLLRGQRSVSSTVYITDPLIPCCRLLQDFHSLLNGCWSGHFVLAACWFNRYLADPDACSVLTRCLSV